MNDSLIIIMGVAMFTVIVLSLVFIILAARAQLVSTGKVKILINDEKTIETEAGGKLLQTLAANNIFLSSACGGGGTCAQCKCIVKSGGGDMIATEATYFTKAMPVKAGACLVRYRLSKTWKLPFLKKCLALKNGKRP